MTFKVRRCATRPDHVLSHTRVRVPFTLFATCDLAIKCLGVHAIESLDVRVAAKFVKMMKKKAARNKFSNLDSSILILLALLHRMVFASILSFFGI